MRGPSALLVVSLACWLGGSALGHAQSQTAPDKPKAKINQCFASHDFEAFRAIDDHAFYMRANMHDYYRIDLAAGCPALTEPGAHLITVVRGSSQICGPLDWDLRIGHGAGPGDFAEACIVSGQTRLSNEEVAAIPPKLKP